MFEVIQRSNITVYIIEMSENHSSLIICRDLLPMQDKSRPTVYFLPARDLEIAVHMADPCVHHNESVEWHGLMVSNVLRHWSISVEVE